MLHHWHFTTKYLIISYTVNWLSTTRLTETSDLLLHDVLEAQHHPQLFLQLFLIGSVFRQVTNRLGTTANQRQPYKRREPYEPHLDHSSKTQRAAHQQGRVDHLRVGVVKEQDESWQAALILDNSPAVHGVSGQVPQLVDHGQRVRLRIHGWPSLLHAQRNWGAATHIKLKYELTWGYRLHMLNWTSLMFNISVLE